MLLTISRSTRRKSGNVGGGSGSDLPAQPKTAAENVPELYRQNPSQVGTAAPEKIFPFGENFSHELGGRVFEPLHVDFSGMGGCQDAHTHARTHARPSKPDFLPAKTAAKRVENSMEKQAFDGQKLPAPLVFVRNLGGSIWLKPSCVCACLHMSRAILSNAPYRCKHPVLGHIFLPPGVFITKTAV